MSKNKDVLAQWVACTYPNASAKRQKQYLRDWQKFIDVMTDILLNHTNDDVSLTESKLNANVDTQSVRKTL